MSKSTEVTPILIKDKDKVYRILNIIYEKDNSIYFTFPSKRKRAILSFDEKYYDNKIYSEHIRTLKEFTSDSLEPKVSFHAPNKDYPNSMVVHINSNKIGSIINNREVLNVGHGKEVFIYLMQIIIPSNLSFFDEYKNKHDKFIEIDKEKLKGNTLSLEFIIHSTKIKEEDYYLPFPKVRLFYETKTFITSNNLTCSVVISALNNFEQSENSNYLLLSINTKDTHGLYTMVNI